jgi:hypothetical protein
MPTINQSRVSNSKLGPVIAPQPITAPQPPALPVSIGVTQSPYMLAPMPIRASGSDSLGRQFYGGSGFPQTRILPARSQK